MATAVWTRYDGSRDIAQAASTLSASVLTVTKQGSGQGTVTSAPGGIDCGPVCAGLFSFYAPVTLTATPATGSRFTGWSGDCSGQATTCRLDPSEARTTTAGFCPPKTLRPGKLKRNKKKGTARLAVTAGGVGKVVLRKSKQVRKSSKEVGSNGRGRLRVKVRGRKAKKLRRNGRVRVRIRLIYRPGDDCPDKTATRKVKLVRK